MKLYWADLREWLGRALTAAAVTAAGAIGGWLAGGGIVTGILIGLGYYALTRLIGLGLRRASQSPGDLIERDRWRYLRRFTRHREHGAWLVNADAHVVLQIRRRRGRGIVRVRWDGAEMYTKPSREERQGTVPVDVFIISSLGNVHRLNDMWSFREQPDGCVAFADLGDWSTSRRTDFKEAMQLEHALGLATPSHDELDELVAQLSTAAPGRPVLLGCEGDG